MVPKPSIGWLTIHHFKLVKQTPPVNRCAPRTSTGLRSYVRFRIHFGHPVSDRFRPAASINRRRFFIPKTENRSVWR